MFMQEFCGKVACQCSQRSHDEAGDHHSLETFLVIFTVFIELGAEQFECTDRGNDENGRSICSHHDVEHPHPCRRVEHRSQRIDVDQFAVHQIEASRCVHE